LPLSEKTRIELYIPDLSKQAYEDLLRALAEEFTYTFGGCSIFRGIEGGYLARLGFPVKDRVNILYTDLPLGLSKDRAVLALYADKLRAIDDAALEEEAILVVA
jgi:hypothetical protein